MKRGLFVAALTAVALLSVDPAVTAGQGNPDRGREILNRSCVSCHDLRPIETQALDSAGWLDIINTMVGNGAEVGTFEQLILLDYLVRNHGPVPDGDGKELLLNRCTVCHTLDRVRAHQGTPELWHDAVQSMLNEGAFLTDPEYDILVDYLSEHFGPRQ
jgi:mono/diheme cytochrome c family protein